MPTRIRKEIDKLKKLILSVSARVEESVTLAVKAIDKKDNALPQQVIENDIEIDKMEVDTEEECLKILALYQPVAIDLRFIVAVLKINNDLERIGDLAVNIAKRAVYLSTQNQVEIPFDFSGMAEKTQEMLRKSLDALVGMDAALAKEVCEADQVVDSLHKDMYMQVQEAIKKYPERVDCFIQLLSVSRNLERIADLTTNIAEDVIYMSSGDIIRHSREIQS